ncbi:MAG: alpha-L-fucosidase [Cellulosilyticaceae bacterium]
MQHQRTLSWDEMAYEYTCPEWFAKAKFGIWAHWGPQCVPKKGGGWYARHMYMEDVGTETFGQGAYEYHTETYGHPSEFGFKDLLPLWKAENFDANAVMRKCTEWGAKYFTVTSAHHDHFDNFDSTYHEWNSMNMGPKRDIVGEFARAARKEGLRFGVASHDNRHLEWWQVAFGADKTGEKAGVPYDGHVTKADGRGKWWEGFDPHKLYGLPPAQRSQETYEEEMANWMLRHTELIEKYKPDLLYYDWFGFSYGEYGKEIARRLHNQCFNDKGFIDTTVMTKMKIPGCIYDVECGLVRDIEKKPWQTETTFMNWFYKEMEPKHNSRSIIEFLIDAVSRNGNLLLSVELLPDGTYPTCLVEIMDEVGEWLRENGEGIYESTPWKVYGEGPSVVDSHEESSPHFNQRTKTSPLYESSEVRFTQRDGNIYIFPMNPQKGKLTIGTLGTLNNARITAIRGIGKDNIYVFQQKADCLEITLEDTDVKGCPIGLKVLFE